MKIKRIIAREGLIIICLIAMGSGLLTLGSWQSRRHHGLVTEDELKKAGVFEYTSQIKGGGFDLSSAIPATSLPKEQVMRLALHEALKREGLHLRSRGRWLNGLPVDDPLRSQSQTDMVQWNRGISEVDKALEFLSDKAIAGHARISLANLDALAQKKIKKFFLIFLR